ncbi:nuclear transport factor 2 family protein [Nocardioides sp.]|uniref:nuclear transport factor 2 family protein n=1 Tax=Nocardioides sp. TaxID=35761 RepID=UPI0019965AD2|nr:nuclear transport factor 2 family protein [Nocardioides sp.]MBC7277197.1 nuclear transport factor 2 family protein [Nocardioides sp.]
MGEHHVARDTRKVLESHLRRRSNGDLESDLAENYADDVVLLSSEGVHHGHDGVRLLATILGSYVSSADYHYQQLLVEGEVGMLQWSASGAGVRIHDGADSYVVRGGLIVAQTIHYSTRPTDDTSN